MIFGMFRHLASAVGDYSRRPPADFFYCLDVSPCTHSLAVALEDGGVGPLAELLQLNVRFQLSEGRVALKTRRR